MKQKLVIGGLCLALVLGMVACGHQAEQEPQEPSQEVHQTDPAPTPSVEPTATPMEIKQEVPQQAEENPEESAGLEEASPVDTSDEADGNDEVTSDGEVDPFTPVEEVVYATGTVNIRSGPSTDTEKLGSLTRSQSVTRTGIGTGDYAKWSRVELEDGRVVYIASSYLSTTKPTTQSTSGGSTTTTTKPSGGSSTGTQGTTQTQPSGGGTSSSDRLSSIGQALKEMPGLNTGDPNAMIKPGDPGYEDFVQDIVNALNP